jgi:hypothetical protein
MGWFVVGADDVISVYNYKNMMQKVTSFKANSIRLSLAIHPTQPYALSTSINSRFNKVQSAGYKDLNTIFMLSWMREKRREKRCWL